ncbi:Bromodomain containing protein [Trichomonas vaginalis G3]|uniref:Bromodomain containing protein n=1 Tax=Trichomonas vaginalis (strain ATCC PRA-98 / G3) TaxID=412133 RepID=A2EWQ5_TRIV3|nr:acetylation-dependent protein binding [Trichomonas vaginalis G3]EAY02943.1 Bromodomain containing protein [Trichomonas vaginalis G3]KAI5521793.1 acetylation-dependent protein binding [Trichomonas vaginalis G3]|eukprot:XP_001315166.1 Bromodomain containing protein [Trichomonas vaginalis G3]
MIEPQNSVVPRQKPPAQPKSHSKLCFTCFNSPSKTLPKVVVLYSGPTNIPPAITQTKQSKGAKNKAAPVPRGPLTPQQKIMNDIHKKLVQRDKLHIFAQPVTEDIAPRYFEVVSQPMDLSTIKQKMHEESYQITDFQDDVFLMIKNCMTYNPDSSFYYQEAANLYQFFLREIKKAKRQLSGEAPREISSAVRKVTAGGEMSHTSITTQSTIPTKIQSFIKKRQGNYVAPVLDNTDKKRTFIQLSNPHPNVLKIGESARFSVFVDTVKQNKQLRLNLQSLLNKFSRDVMNDAIRSMANLSDTYEIDAAAIDEALASTLELNNLKEIDIVDAPTDEYSLRALANQIPNLSITNFKQSAETIQDPAISSLKLLLFYQNTMRFWPDASLDNAKRTIVKTLTSDITNHVITMKPSIFVKDQYATNALLHLVKSAK